MSRHQRQTRGVSGSAIQKVCLPDTCLPKATEIRVPLSGGIIFYGIRFSIISTRNPAIMNLRIAKVLGLAVTGFLLTFQAIFSPKTSFATAMVYLLKSYSHPAIQNSIFQQKSYIRLYRYIFLYATTFSAFIDPNL